MAESPPSAGTPTPALGHRSPASAEVPFGVPVGTGLWPPHSIGQDGTVAQDSLPLFRYHPDPLGTGSVRPSDGTCRICGVVRGWLYTGPIYGADEPGAEICPWCIANGSAAEQLDGEFTDVGWGVPDDVPSKVLDELATRTPGFEGWQQEHWLFHCGAAGAYLGRVGYTELRDYPDALEMVFHEHEEAGWSSEDSQSFARQLSRDGEATAHLFRCLVCGCHLAYSDAA
jgi:uncharacterized protein